MDKMLIENIVEVNKKLSVVVALLLKITPRENQEISLRDQIQLLNDLNLRPVEIASILGRQAKYVNKELAIIRKGK
jgi:hypothetical protein